MRKRTRNILIGLAALILVAIGLYFVPPIHARLAWRLDALQTNIYYFFHPPQKVVFKPNQQSVLTQTENSPTPAATATPTITPLPVELATPTITLTPVPQSVILGNIPFVDQSGRWNYCGPANLAMALKYWGWTGTKLDIGAIVKPGVNDPSLDPVESSKTDVNVMPYEMVNYVNDYTSYRALWRVGGNMDLLKRLIAAGFPVITEKGIYENLAPEYTLQWAGHYAFTTGYDDSQQVMVWQDSFLTDQEPVGTNKKMSYSDYLKNWRAFDYVFIVVYPPEREADLFQVLGPWYDETWAAQNALDTAAQEIPNLTGFDLLTAWFNKGTSYGLLADYGDAAIAYDTFFQLYDAMPEKDRPYRIFAWYQTGPLKAYYWTSRYQDTINLANANLATMKPPKSSEENLYYRALAEAALQEYDSAYADMRLAVYYNKNFQLALDKLAQWGISP